MSVLCQQVDLNNKSVIKTIKKMLYEYLTEIGIAEDAPKRHFIPNIEIIYRPPNSIFSITENGNILGFVFLKEIAPSIGEVKHLYVAKHARGRKLGELLLRTATNHGLAVFKRLRLDSQHSLVAAIALYRKLGFYEIERYNDNPHAQVFFEIGSSPHNVKIRAYQTADAKALAAIYYHTIHTVNACDYTEEQV